MGVVRFRYWMIKMIDGGVRRPTIASLGGLGVSASILLVRDVGRNDGYLSRE